jgi:Spy/CpxP family protein refolding chaperone
MNLPKRNQWSAISLAILLFGCGVVVGVLANRSYSEWVVNARSSDTFRERYLKEMKSDVHLTDQQITQLQTILDETKARYKSLRDQYHPALMSIRDDQIKKVKGILTPEQVPLYEKLVAERERRAREDDHKSDHHLGGH